MWESFRLQCWGAFASFGSAGLVLRVEDSGFSKLKGLQIQHVYGSFRK